MPTHHLGSLPSAAADGDGVMIDLRGLEAVRRKRPEEIAADALEQTDREQFARDIVEIERATAALRKAEPALESWSDLPAATAQKKPRPVWLLIGALWLSTALITAGAAVAIARLVG